MKIIVNTKIYYKWEYFDNMTKIILDKNDILCHFVT